MRLAKAAWLAWYEAMFAPFAGCLRLAGPIVARVLPDVPDHCDQCRAELAERAAARGEEGRHADHQ